MAGSTLSNPARNLVCQRNGSAVRISSSGSRPTKHSKRRNPGIRNHDNHGNHRSLCNRRSHARQPVRRPWPTRCSPCRTHRTSPGSHRRFLLHQALPDDPAQRSAIVLHRRSARPQLKRRQPLRTSTRRLPAPAQISSLAFSSKSVSPVTLSKPPYLECSLTPATRLYAAPIWHARRPHTQEISWSYSNALGSS